MQQRFTDKLLSNIETTCASKHGKQTVLLFGTGGAHGFGFVKGGGVKGPVVKLRSLLSKRFPLIHVSEFRTSTCCFHCGKVLCHPKLRPPKEPKDGAKRSKNRVMHGVSYCTETDHHSMLNRDVDAARKIGYRFLCQLSEGVEKLGHWNPKFRKEDLHKGRCSALYDFALKRYPADFEEKAPAG